MFIHVDNDHNITQVVSVGVPSANESGWYEIQNDQVSKDILDDIFSYKYVDGAFVRNQESNPYLQMIQEAKIHWLSEQCNQVIENGIDYNGEHYSLKETDQINLSKIDMIARSDSNTPLLYHPDNGLCRLYTKEEIMAISEIAIAWVTLHTTIFNYSRAYINTLTDIDDIQNFKYGQTLPVEFQTLIDTIKQTYGITYDDTIEDIIDYHNYIIGIDLSHVPEASVEEPVVPYEDEEYTEEGIEMDEESMLPNYRDFPNYMEMLENESD